jgi:hypothetical protein
VHAVEPEEALGDAELRLCGPLAASREATLLTRTMMRVRGAPHEALQEPVRRERFKPGLRRPDLPCPLRL